MKKLLSLILAVTVCLSVCACAKGEDNNSSAETSADNTESGSATEYESESSAWEEESAVIESAADSSAEESFDDSSAEESSVEEEPAFDINDYIGKWVNGKKVEGIYDYEFRLEKVNGDKVYFNWYKREASMMDGSLYAMSLTGTVSGKLVTENKATTKLTSWAKDKIVTMTVTFENDKVTLSFSDDLSGMWFEMFENHPPRTLVLKRA